MSRVKKALIVLLIVVTFTAVPLWYMVVENQEPIVLDGVEIREYRGEELSSITDFRENSLRGPQYIDNESYRLNITGLVEEEQSLTIDEVIEGQKSYKKVSTLYCVEGWSATILWEGVLVRDLIEEADVSPETKVVIFRAYDGYSTSLPLDYIMENDILLAYKMNEVVIPPERGYPFQLVAEDKWGYKWIKWVTEIELSDDEDFRGFWEEAGYSNDADIDGGFYEKR